MPETLETLLSRLDYEPDWNDKRDLIAAVIDAGVTRFCNDPNVDWTEEVASFVLQAIERGSPERDQPIVTDIAIPDKALMAVMARTARTEMGAGEGRAQV